MKTVIIGFGAAADTLGHDQRMAKYFPKGSHAAVLADHPAYDWMAVVDPRGEARNRAAEQWCIPNVVADLARLPDAQNYECAVIATPPEHRAGILEQLPNLKAIMLEKPLATSLTAAQDFCEACEGRGIRVQVNYWRRGVAGFQALADGGLNELVGQPRAVFGVFGGGLRNIGSHLIDFIRLLFGEIAVAVPSNNLRPAPDGALQGDVSASVTMRLRNGAPVCLLPTDFREYREASLDIWGSMGRLTIEQESLVTRVYRRVKNRGLDEAWEVASDAPETLDIPVGDAFVRLYDNLADVVFGSGGLLSPLESALMTESLVDRIIGNSADNTPRTQIA